MTKLRIPHGVWDWKYTVLVLALLLTPLLSVLQLAPDARSLPAAAGIKSLVTNAAALSAAVFVYLHWRLSGSRVSAWLVLVLTVGAVQGLALAGLAVARPALLEQQVGWLMVTTTAVKASLVGVVLVSERYDISVDPIALGLAVGGGFSVVRYLLLEQAPGLETGHLSALVMGLMACGLSAALAQAILGLSTPPAWVRTRLALATLLLGVSGAIGLPRPDHGLDSTLALVSGMLGAALLCGTTLAMLRQSIWDEKSTVSDLHDRLARIEADVRVNRARLHEIDSTVAGIASASRLIRATPSSTHTISPQRRGALQDMMQTEVERLERLLSQHSVGDLRPVDLDEVIGHLVTSHRARGRVVTWQPAGEQAVGRADDIAEVVNILLDNAAKHGSASGTEVVVRQVGESVRISVTDSGDGVPAEMRDQLFAWGVRGPDSGGQGIGLHIAHELVTGLGGLLHLEDHAGPGARFVVELPAAEHALVPAPVLRKVG